MSGGHEDQIFFFRTGQLRSLPELLIYTDTSLFINTGHLKLSCVCGPRIESSLSSGHYVYLDKPSVYNYLGFSSTVTRTRSYIIRRRWLRQCCFLRNGENELRRFSRLSLCWMRSLNGIALHDCMYNDRAALGGSEDLLVASIPRR